MFSIITPTYKRKDQLDRAVASVVGQTVMSWEMIIVNDSPEDSRYSELRHDDPRIKYIVNDTNHGVNYSRNKALDMLSPKSLWVIFLDDDDYLAPDALAILTKIIEQNSNISWILTNRAYEDGTSITQGAENNTLYSYFWDYLFLKKIKGDATHCIKTTLISNIRFAKTVPQAEEWFFFYQIGLKTNMYYFKQNTTLSCGYSLENGLNFRKRKLEKEIKTLLGVAREGYKKKLCTHPTFILYILLRIFRMIIK